MGEDGYLGIIPAIAMMFIIRFAPINPALARNRVYDAR